MLQNQLTDYIRDHAEWRRELSEAPFFLSIKDDGKYTIFSYNQIKSDFKNPIVQLARGIILRITEVYAGYSRAVNCEIACWPYNKFFNYGEGNAAEIDWTSARVQEKIDGSIIKVWHDHWVDGIHQYSGWHISTNGMINAFKTDLQVPMNGIATFGDLFMDAWNKDPGVKNGDIQDSCLNPDYTWIFELVSPLNRVVVPYKDSMIFLTGCRSNVSGEEIDVHQLGYPFKRPKIFNFGSIDDILENIRDLPYDEEGYVVVDKDFNRVKIKSLAYLAAHHLKNNGVINLERAFDLVKKGEQDEFLAYFPEYTDVFNEVGEKFRHTLVMIGAAQAAAEGWKKECETKKEFAMRVLQEEAPLRPYMFAIWDGKEKDLSDLTYDKLF